jgi:NAD(P)-dependent dehydrogenase (short-subunit alcohol dehydrogenase family)
MKKSGSGSGIKGAIFVTGASSGIGKEVALHLARRGFLALATVRRAEAEEELASLGQNRLIPLRLDLNGDADFPGLASRVEAECAKAGLPGLAALVNNAGGSLVGPIELIEVKRFKAELEARILGPIALLQALLPSIRRAKGRLLWIATPALLPTPYVTGIHACDFAVNCLARSLALELRPWGTAVSLIRCGGIATRAGRGTIAEIEASLREAPPEKRVLYEAGLRSWGASMAGFDARRSPVSLVAQTVEKALLARRPRPRYQVGYFSGLGAFLELLPQGAVDAILRARG